MGIPGFNTWFYANNKQAYQTLQHTQTDHLYIDMNSVLHNVLRKAENYDKYHALLHKRLDMILRLTSPRKSVMLAIDGPAPLAKLITQRERRKKSFTSEERKKERQQSSNKKKQRNTVVSSTALTPGTPFMHDVAVSCSYFICSRLATYKWKRVEFELSGPTVAGEGEVKILGRLARPRHPTAVAPTDTHLIVGDDADLILMALVSNTPRLYILNSALSGNELSPKTAVLSVDKLHQAWLKAGTAGIKLTQQQLQQLTQGLSEDLLLRLLGAKADLALLAIMSSGNDYLPAVKGAPKLETLWASYVKLRQLPEFANSSMITMTHNSSSSSSSSSGTQHYRDIAAHAEVDTLMLAEVLAVSLEGNKYLQQLKTRTQIATAGAAGGGHSNGSSGSSNVSLGMVAAEALPWLEGLLWTMSMYFAGDCPDYRWTYTGPPPTATGLRALAAAATAAMEAAAAAPGPTAAAAANGSSDHHRLSLGSFSLDSAAAAAGRNEVSGSLAAWQAVVAAAAVELGGSSSSGNCEALLPHVCSLALLPAGAVQHVPAAVAHLMDESSPIADIYATCDGCEAVAAESYKAQMQYNAVLDKAKSAESQIASLQKQQDLSPAQQQQLQQLQTDLADLLNSKAAALTVLNSAQDARRAHEAADHPGGVDTFDLDRLEAAVAAVPDHEFQGSQRVLTQLSHSLLFRSGQQQQQQQYGGGYYGGQQQQFGRSYSSSSGGGSGGGGSRSVFGSVISPPPPPVERFGPAFGRSPGAVVLRSMLLESARDCVITHDPDVTMYSNYMVVGTDDAAAAAAATSRFTPAAAEIGAIRDPQQQQQQAPKAAAAAALKAVLKGSGIVRPADAAASHPPLKSPKTAAGESAGSLLPAAAVAAAEAATALAAQKLGQQQQQGRRSRRPGRSRSPTGRSPAAAAAASAVTRPPRQQSSRSRAPKQQQQYGQQQYEQQQYGQQQYGQQQYGQQQYKQQQYEQPQYEQQQQQGAVGPPPPSSVPMPSGSLLGRVAGSGGSSSRWSHAYQGQLQQAPQQQQQQLNTDINRYDSSNAYDGGAGGLAPMQYEYPIPQQQPAAVAVPQAYAGQSYNPLQQQQHQYQQHSQQQQQPVVYYAQQQQQPPYQPVHPPQYSQQYTYQYPQQMPQQQQPAYQPLRSVSPAAAAGSSVLRPVSSPYAPPPQTYHAARPQHYGINLPRP